MMSWEHDKADAARVGALGTMATAEPVLDPVTIERLMSLQSSLASEDVIGELTRIFTRDARRYLAEVSAAIAKGELEPAADGLHALKGASLSVGASQVAWLCRELEPLARAGAVDATSGLAALEDAIETALSALAQLKPAAH